MAGQDGQAALPLPAPAARRATAVKARGARIIPGAASSVMISAAKGAVISGAKGAPGHPARKRAPLHGPARAIGCAASARKTQNARHAPNARRAAAGRRRVSAKLRDPASSVRKASAGQLTVRRALAAPLLGAPPLPARQLNRAHRAAKFRCAKPKWRRSASPRRWPAPAWDRAATSNA
jgi:hypothetical protein